MAEPQTIQEETIPAPVSVADPVVVSPADKASAQIKERTIQGAETKFDAAERLRQEDIASRKEFQTKEPVDYDTWAKSIMDTDGVEFLGETPVDAALLRQAEGDVVLRADLIGKYESNKPASEMGGAVTAFTTASGQFDKPAFEQAVGTEKYNDLLPRAVRTQKAQTSLLRTFEDMGMDKEVAELVSNDILEFRGVAKETMTRFKQAGRFIGMAIPDFAFLTLPSAVTAMVKTGDIPGGAEFGSEYDIIKRDFESAFSGWKNTLTENVPALDIADSFNATIHDQLAEKYEGDKYEDLAFERTKTGEFAVNEEGQRIKKQFVQPQNIETMLNATYNTLNTWEKYGVDVTEELIWAGTTGPIAAGRATSRINKIMSYKNSPKYAKQLENIDDPEEILAFVNRNGAKEKADDYFKIGVVQTQVNKEIKYSKDRIKEIDAELKLETTDDTARRELLAERNQLVNTMRGARLSRKTIPYVKDVGESALIIGSGTALARETSVFSDDPEASAAIGNMLMTFGGYRIGYGATGLGKKILSAGGGAVKYGVPTIFEMGRTIAASIPGVGPILVEGTMKNIENALGSGVVLGEQAKENIRNIIKLHQNMNPKTRQQSLRHMDETAALHKKIVDRLPPEKRERFNELMLQSYGNTHGLISLAAAGELNRGKINLETLSKFDLVDMEADLADMESNFILAGEALAAMKDMVLDIDDVAGQQIVKNFVAAREAGLGRLAEKIEVANKQRVSKLNDLEDWVIKFGPRGELDEDMLSALEAYRRQVSKSAGEVYNPIEFLQGRNAKLNKLVDDSLEKARGLRDTPAHADAVKEAVESLHIAKKNRIEIIGSTIYEPVRELAKESGPISLKPLVDDIISANGVDGIKKFFGPSSVLYTGRDGKKVKQALESMFETAFNRRSVAELKAMLVDAAETGAERNRFKDMQPLQVAVEMMTARGRDGELLSPDFNPFMAADPYDLELVRRAFKRASSTFASSGKPDVAAEYGRYIDKLDETVEGQASEAYFTAITDARPQYEMEVGLPQSPKLLLDKYEKTRIRRINELGVGYKFKNVYAENPSVIFDDFAEAVVEALMPSTTAKMQSPTQNRLPNLVNNLVMSYGQFSNKHGEFVFDLSTETGKAGFNDLQKVLNEIILTRTGSTFLENYRSARKLNRRVPAGLDPAPNSELLNFADDVTQDLNVSFILEEGGDVVQQPLMDIVDAVSVKESLGQAIKETPIVARAFNKLGDDFEKFKNIKKDDLDVQLSKENRTFKLIDDATKSLSSQNFADNFIFTPEGGELKVLKERVESVLVASGMSPEDAADSFQTVAVYHTMVGLFERAGRGNVSGKVTTRAAGEKVSEAIFSPEVVLGELQKPAVRRNLEEILDPDHIDFLEDIMQHLNDSKTAVNVRGASGDYAGIGLAGKVSRIYNGVKGVVNPAYIATEYAITAAKAGQISMMKLALTDKAAAKILHKFLKTPNLIGGNDMKKFDNILKNFLFTELAQEGQKIVMEGEGDLTTGLQGMAEGAVEGTIDAAEAVVDFVSTTDEEQDNDETDTQGE